MRKILTQPLENKTNWLHRTYQYIRFVSGEIWWKLIDVSMASQWKLFEVNFNKARGAASSIDVRLFFENQVKSKRNIFSCFNKNPSEIFLLNIEDIESESLDTSGSLFHQWHCNSERKPMEWNPFQWVGWDPEEFVRFEEKGVDFAKVQPTENVRRAPEKHFWSCNSWEDVRDRRRFSWRKFLWQDICSWGFSEINKLEFVFHRVIRWNIFVRRVKLKNAKGSSTFLRDFERWGKLWLLFLMENREKRTEPNRVAQKRPEIFCRNKSGWFLFRNVYLRLSIRF